MLELEILCGAVEGSVHAADVDLHAVDEDSVGFRAEVAVVLAGHEVIGDEIETGKRISKGEVELTSRRIIVTF